MDWGLRALQLHASTRLNFHWLCIGNFQIVGFRVIIGCGSKGLGLRVHGLGPKP